MIVRRSRAQAVAALGCLLAIGAAARAAEAPSWRVAQADVRITVPLRPGGGFEAKTTSLAGTLTLATAQPVALSGELAVDLTTIDTGIDLRNHHLREKYLEVAKPGFEKAVLSEIRLADANGEGFEGKSGFAGTLRLHGVSKPVTGTAEIRREGTAVRVVANFAILLTDFGVTPPEYMGVGVGSKLGIRVSLLAGRGAGK
jgi:polyisoprenoid-binding protein YceI